VGEIFSKLEGIIGSQNGETKQKIKEREVDKRIMRKRMGKEE
jgi:hypothetical protein